MCFSDTFETDPAEVRTYVVKFIDKFEAKILAKRGDADFVWKIDAYPTKEQINKIFKQNEK
tara:strand:+ start:813 stop:995 length:183 start_codon:yes stop_codon:yes gene_type:complete